MPPAAADPRAVGILGGTFNPPHRGHLLVAEHALRELALDLVLLMPVHTAPHKADGADPGPRHRLEMCRLACAPGSGVQACGLEVERGGPSYTVDTLRAINATHPSAELTFIVGADTACTLPSWREPAELLELARLAVAARSGSDRAGVLDAVGRAAGAPPPAGRVTFLEMPACDASSSQARALVAAGEDVSALVGEPVAAYIAEHGLYRDTDGEEASR